MMKIGEDIENFVDSLCREGYNEKDIREELKNHYSEEDITEFFSWFSFYSQPRIEIANVDGITLIRMVEFEKGDEEDGI